MNEALLDAFRHNSWATKQLLAACCGLSEEQLTSPATASYIVMSSNQSSLPEVQTLLTGLAMGDRHAGTQTVSGSRTGEHKRSSRPISIATARW
jgi:hypothetical protein